MSVSIELVLMQTKHCTSATGSFRIIFWLLNCIESTGVDPVYACVCMIHTHLYFLFLPRSSRSFLGVLTQILRRYTRDFSSSENSLQLS
ncbi:hypothetical protein GYMLUDRAFT_587364 [Collybiopsis luxurians FD-317 M1]|uniref:Uncharacterized protein n=1 Tax=Collybiopsis luxurians FD-317 M1 TaxID=944289 RepID=A0A0D0CER1_9AGAR|nr:hypothetical protein GYMLUDRAFT_587364 [Collybiopsis luxurians FD-317 M1]